MIIKRLIYTLLFIGSSSLGMLAPYRVQQIKPNQSLPTPFFDKKSQFPGLSNIQTRFNTIADSEDIYEGLGNPQLQTNLFGSEYMKTNRTIIDTVKSPVYKQCAQAYSCCNTIDGQYKYLATLAQLKTTDKLKECVDEIETVKLLGRHSNERRKSLVEDPDDVNKPALQNYYQRFFPQNNSFSSQEEKFYLMKSEEQQLLLKMYNHFAHSGKTSIDLSTQEWKILQGLPIETKREFRSLDQFFTAHRKPTDEEKKYHVVGTIGQGICSAMGLGIPFALMKQFGEGALNSIPSGPEFSHSAKNYFQESLNITIQEAIHNAETSGNLPFQEPEDIALGKIVQTGKEVFHKYPLKVKNNIMNVAYKQADDVVENGWQSMSFSSAVFNMRPVLIGGTLGAISGWYNIDQPCETKNISQIT